LKTFVFVSKTLMFSTLEKTWIFFEKNPKIKPFLSSFSRSFQKTFEK